jgi:predicted metalloprotease with PDZ domain
MINFQISLDNAYQHLIDVRVDIDMALNEGQEFWLPDWIPGSYMIRDFARNITKVEAFENAKPIRLEKSAKSTWQLMENVDQLTLVYQVYAWDLSVRSAHFDQQHCFFNGTSTFLAVRGYEESGHKVQIAASTNDYANDWKVATSMTPVAVNSAGFGEYQSKSYHELIDHPFEISDLLVSEFSVNGIVHRMVFTEAPEGIDLERITKDVQTICQYEVDFFGDEKPPFDDYLFMTFVQKDGFGGLEHMSSTALHCGHADLPKLGDDVSKKSKDYQKFLSLCSHEYFHCWNVKRIKPARFKPYELQKEVHTELLWFFEGITSYYDELFLVRCGVIEASDYLDMIAKNITRYIRGSGASKQSISESSFDAWTKFYKQDENASNAIVSYYVKGGLIAFCLDFEIRRLTNDEKNLDDLMRLIWSEFGRAKEGVTAGVVAGVEEKDILRMAEQLVGESMVDFFQQMLYSTDPLPLDNLFQDLGIRYQTVSERRPLDPGGFCKQKVTDRIKNSLGATFKEKDGGTEIAAVFDNGTASNNGLANKDIIIAFDGYRIKSGEIVKYLADKVIGAEVEISYFRRDKLYHTRCQLTPSTENTCFLSFAEDTRNEVYKRWLEIK